jgi:hypothetical protein
VLLFHRRFPGSRLKLYHRPDKHHREPTVVSDWRASSREAVGAVLAYLQSQPISGSAKRWRAQLLLPQLLQLKRARASSRLQRHWYEQCWQPARELLKELELGYRRLLPQQRSLARELGQPAERLLKALGERRRLQQALLTTEALRESCFEELGRVSTRDPVPGDPSASGFGSKKLLAKVEKKIDKAEKALDKIRRELGAAEQTLEGCREAWAELESSRAAYRRVREELKGLEKLAESEHWRLRQRGEELLRQQGISPPPPVIQVEAADIPEQPDLVQQAERVYRSSDPAEQGPSGLTGA